MMCNSSRIVTALVIAASVLASACKSDHALGNLGKERVDGQLFIVQKNRENIKLGDVKIILVERRVFDATLDEAARQSQSMEGFMDYSRQWRSVSDKIESDCQVYVRSRNEDIRISAEHALRKVKKEKLAFENTEFARSMGGHWAFYQAGNHRLAPIRLDQEALQKLCLSYLFYASGNYAHLAVTTTDADGKFSLNIPTYKDCLVLVKSSRSLMGAADEDYYWVHPLDPGMTGALILSNSNMVTPGRLRQMLSACRVELKSLPLDVVMKEHKLPSLEWYSEWREAMRAYNKAEREEERIRSLIETKKRELDGLTLED
ncbi:MAG: hypothetical protein H7A51_01685 [Akkermansiaceae bacterium]|nr:hypothetical protein [Akkermansiaceae bacterium]